ncbi:MAG: AMIN domain-containing protein [Deltaproteobacteria bacterium]|nr:AMIN domain-containing protein [Deltaproteobacteria bacterium]
MTEKRFKSLTIRIAAGAIVLFIIIFGLFLSGKKPSQSPMPETGIPVAMKIPKSNPTLEPSDKKISANIPSSESVPETTIEEKIPEPDETLLNSENPFNSEETGKAELVSVEDKSEEGDKAESISDRETSEEEEKATSISVHETDEFTSMEATEKIEEEPIEEAGSIVYEEPEIEKTDVKEQPETESVATEKKSYSSEYKEKRIMRNIVLSQSGSEQKLIFQCDSPIINYKYFILSNPPRLVVDLQGNWKDPDFLEKKVDSSLVSRIRLWNHGDKLRIVNDLKSDKTIFPVFTKSSEGVEVVLKTR